MNKVLTGSLHTGITFTLTRKKITVSRCSEMKMVECLGKL